MADRKRGRVTEKRNRKGRVLLTPREKGSKRGKGTPSLTKKREKRGQRHPHRNLKSKARMHSSTESDEKPQYHRGWQEDRVSDEGDTISSDRTSRAKAKGKKKR